MNLIYQRKSLYPISNIFLNRWSPRAMSNEFITNEQLMTLFEAACWAPSAYNEQPWRFIYTRKGTELWGKLLALMTSFNQSWAKNVTILVVLISKKFFEHDNSPSNTHSFDAGAAWMSLALQGSISGLATRAIAGFNYDNARTVLNLPLEFKIEIMITVGKLGKKEELSTELQVREKPSERKPLKDIVFENNFK